MDTIPKSMPVGIQDFEKLRTTNYMYVDKTQYVYQLAKEHRPYFLSRPRRFGKSLFLSTLKAFFFLFMELFEGLAIAELEKDWIQYPVLYIDFNIGSSDSLQSVDITLNAIFDKYEKEWGITKKYESLAVRLTTLIDTAFEKTGKRVVVLVDEYDKALVNTMDDPQSHNELLAFFKGFYGILKGMDYALRFVFLTGVTKFAKVSVFSDLNQLTDISLVSQYAEICGISEAELLSGFQAELNELAKATKKTYDETVAEIKKRYDGYRFAPNGASLVPLLYQTGYLSIKSYDNKYDELILGFPNEEVKYGFLNELLSAFAPQVIVDSSI
jgi:hypothetical protein